jgi:hypothetical protein
MRDAIGIDLILVGLIFTGFLVGPWLLEKLGR